MAPAQIPRVDIDLGDDMLNYANILSGSSGHIDNMYSSSGYHAFGDTISYSQNPTQSPVGVPTDPKNIKRAKRAKNFSIQEDNLLVSAWLNTSLDPIIGNDQKGAAYWKRIWDYFYAEKTFELECDRNQGSLMHRRSGIQLEVNKYCGIYAEVERTRASGTTEQDRIAEANQKYRKERGYNFSYDHCWNVLKFLPKWNSELSRKKPIKKTHGTIPATSSPITPCTIPDAIDLVDDGAEINESPSLERPIGKKAAKSLVSKAIAKRENGGSQI